MADETVDIGNVGKGGVASEATLESLVKAVEFLAKKEGFDPKKSAEKAKKLAESFDDTITVVTDNRDALKDNTEAVEESTSALDKLSSGLAFAAGVSITALGNFASELLSGGSQLTDFAKHIPGIGSLLTPLTSYLDETMNSFREMSSIGGAFNNSLVEIRKAAVGTYMTLDEFTGFIVKNSRELAQFGGTVTNGAKRLVELNAGLGAQREELLNMGFTFEEINEQLVNYQTLQRAGSRTEQRSAAEQAQAAAAYAKNLSTLSKLTGEEIDAINDKVAAETQNVAFQQKLAKMQPGERDKVMAGMAEATALYGEAGAEFFKQQILGMPPLTEETAMLAATMPGLADQIRGLASTAKDSAISLDAFNEGSTDRMVAAMKSAAESGEKFETLLAAGASGLDGPGKQIAAILQGMGKQFTDYSKVVDGQTVFDEAALRADIEAAEEENKKRDALTKGLVSFENGIKGARQTIQTALLDSGLFKHVTEVIGQMADSIGQLVKNPKFIEGLKSALASVSNFISGFIEDVNNNGFAGAISDMFGNIMSGIGDIIGDALFSAFTSPGFIATVAGAIAAVYGTKAVASALSGMGGGGKSPTAPGPSLKPSQTAGGKMGGNIGGFLGGLGGGILEGLTNALAGAGAKAPMIALGAAAIGAAIAAIGAGIAGATWLIGESLPNFSEGMQSFEKLDGARLKSAADGIISMTGAMAAFGASSVVSGIGNLAGGVANKLASFIGGGSPLEKLQEFADADIDIDGVQRNADAIMAFNNAMGGLASEISFDTTGIDNYAVSIANLVDQLENLNDVLQANQTVSGNTTTIPGSTTTAGGNNKDRLNSTMDALLATTMQTSDYLKKIERNTKSMGSDISKGRISDSRG